MNRAPSCPADKTRLTGIDPRPFKIYSGFVPFFQPAFWILLLLACCCFCPDASRGSDEVARKLLKDFWSHTLKKETDKFYQGCQSPNANAIYAYALVKSRQHDVDRALKAIDELHQAGESNPQSWRLKIWLLLRRDKFDQAVVLLPKYVEAVKRDKTLDDFSRAEAYRFAGRVLAFVEGPVTKKTNKVTIETIKRQLLFRLGPDLLNAFSLAYADVGDDFKKFMRDKQNHEENFARQDAKERKIKFASLEKVEEQLSETKEKLNEQSGEIRKEANVELEAIRQQDMPLASRQGALESELSLVNNELVFLINDYNYWNNLALREMDPGQRAFYFRQAGRIDGLIIQQELAASQIRRQLEVVLSERIALRRQFSTTNSIATSQLFTIEKELKDISRQQKVAANQKLRTTKPTRRIITHAASLKTKSASIVTYDQFPLEIERQLLLDKLR